MLFSSTIFLFAFFPMVLTLYFVLLKKKTKQQNLFLVIVSIIFYAWGNFQYVFLLLLSILANYSFARIIGGGG